MENLKIKFIKIRIEGLKVIYRENFKTVFDDKELVDIKDDGEEIVLTEEEEKEFLSSLDNF